jgi:hypothetical protein
MRKLNFLCLLGHRKFWYRNQRNVRLAKSHYTIGHDPETVPSTPNPWTLFPYIILPSVVSRVSHLPSASLNFRLKSQLIHKMVSACRQSLRKVTFCELNDLRFSSLRTVGFCFTIMSRPTLLHTCCVIWHVFGVFVWVIMCPDKLPT